MNEAESKRNHKIELFCILVGFALLPFVWVVNVVWFFDAAFKKAPFDEQNAIRKCKLQEKQSFRSHDSSSLFRCDLLSHRLVYLVHSDSNLDLHISSKQSGLGRVC
jgi:hypothetical protein